MIFISLLIASLAMSSSTSEISISTRNSLSLAENEYSVILFTAIPVKAPDTHIPIQYQFTTTGELPPGMIFEGYPCHRPNTTVCPALASSNGVYLDGVPTSAGSYEVTITATDGQGGKSSKRFTVVIAASAKQ